VRATWSSIVNAVFRRRQRIVSAEDLDRLRRYDAERAADCAVIDRMRAAFQDVPDEELEREIARAIAEVRAEMQAEREQAARTPRPSLLST
jgi:hypothetical protein